MNRSPIEMMVDRACGVDAANEYPVPQKVSVVDDDTQALMNLADAVVSWRTASKNGGANADHVRILNECADVLIKRGWW